MADLRGDMGSGQEIPVSGMDIPAAHEPAEDAPPAEAGGGVALPMGGGGPVSELEMARRLAEVPGPDRRVVTVVSVGLRQFDQWADGQAPSTIQNIMEEVAAQVAAAALEAGAVVFPEAQDGLLVVVGAERVTLHHALRGIFCAASIQARLDALRAIFHSKGTVLPEMQIGIDTGDVVVNLPGVGGGAKRCAGRPLVVASRFRDIAPGGQMLMTETVLDYVMGSLPAEWEVSRVRDAEEGGEALDDGLFENIFPLPEELFGRRVRLGPGVQASPDQAIFDFSYWRGVRVSGSQAQLPALRVATPQTEGIEFEIEETLPDPAHREFAFGKYRMIEKIGEGGMGEVWLARDRFGNRVAIKKLLPNLSISPTQIKRFQREAAIMSRLSHRNICRIFEVGEVDGVSYICMEFVDGVSLRDILLHHTGGGREEHNSFESRDTDVSSLVKAVQEHLSVAGGDQAERPTTADGEVMYRVLPLTQTLAVFTRIGEAMRYAHERGTLHRDLKPANIMLRSDGEPVVMDFGLAKLDMEHDREMSLSISGQIMGTVDYMAPEQARSAKDVTERADIYSLGAILYQMLVGRRHFESTGDLIHDAQALQIHEPVRPRQINPLLDADLEIITLKCLRPEVEGRYLTVGALIEDIEHYQMGEPISAKPVSAPEVLAKLIRRNRAVSTVIGLAVLLLVLFVVVLMYQLSEAKVLQGLASEAKTRAEQASREAQDQRDEAEAAKKKSDEALRMYQEAKSVGELLAVQARQRERDVQTAVEAKKKAVEEVQEQKDVRTREQSQFALGLVVQAERRMFDFDWDKALVLTRDAAGRDNALAEPFIAMARVHLARLNTQEALADLEQAQNRFSGPPTPEWSCLVDAVKLMDKAGIAAGSERADALGQALGLLRASSNLADAAVARYIEVKAPEFFGGDTSKPLAANNAPEDEIRIVTDVVGELIVNGAAVGKLSLSAGESYPLLLAESGTLTVWARKCQVRVPIHATNWKEWSQAREKAKANDMRAKVLDATVERDKSKPAAAPPTPSPDGRPPAMAPSEAVLTMPVQPLRQIVLRTPPTPDDVRQFTASVMGSEEVMSWMRPRPPGMPGIDYRMLEDKLREAARADMATVLAYRAPNPKQQNIFVRAVTPLVTPPDRDAVVGALRQNPHLYSIVRKNNWEDQASEQVREIVKAAPGPLPWEMVAKAASFRNAGLRESLLRQLKTTSWPREVLAALSEHETAPQPELDAIVQRMWKDRAPGVAPSFSMMCAAAVVGEKDALKMVFDNFFNVSLRRYFGADDKVFYAWLQRMVPGLPTRDEQWPEWMAAHVDEVGFDAGSRHYRRN